MLCFLEAARILNSVWFTNDSYYYADFLDLNYFYYLQAYFRLNYLYFVQYCLEYGKNAKMVSGNLH